MEVKFCIKGLITINAAGLFFFFAVQIPLARNTVSCGHTVVSTPTAHIMRGITHMYKHTKTFQHCLHCKEVCRKSLIV